MSNKNLLLSSISFLVTTFALTCVPARSQIIPDGTLPNNSKVIPDGNSNIITDGTTAGSNLFHSFEQFSVPKGEGAYFNNAPDIQNIISRVTGSSISKIDGLLQANGTANLFLLNPNGIIFGPNTSLNIGGSFLGSTASDLRFADGSQFSTTNPQPSPLLTISVPVGLGFTTGTPGSVEVKGYGHNALITTSVVSPIYGTGQSLTGLRTQPGKTIALVGNQVNFDGSVLTAPSGRIEVGSVSFGTVDLNLTDAGIVLNYDGVHKFQDINLDNQALLDASGFLNGNIFLRGENVNLTQRSLIVVSNFGFFPLGEININVEGKLGVAGVRTVLEPNRAEVGPARGIVSQNFSAGKGASIIVSADQLSVQDSGGIATQTFGVGAGGDISLITKNSTQLFSSDLPTTSLTIGSIGTSTAGEGHGGNVQLSTKKLSIENGSTFTTTTFNSGDGGKVTVNASNTIRIIGGREITFNQSYINNSFWASSLGSLSTYSGKAGDVDINTTHLFLENGGLLGSATVASGSAGNLTVNAIESVYVSGRSHNVFSPTQIISSATLTNPFFQQVFNLPNTLLGKSGYLTINTNRLIIRDGAQISVKNDGERNAGSLGIVANSIDLNNQASITATTTNFSSEGGSIFLQAQNLQLRHNSSITANAGGSGNGGNITIGTGTLAALEDSDISANAQKGPGGRVIIDAQGIFGTNFREYSTSQSDITATSDLGPQFSGTVQINTPDVDPSRGLVTLPTEPVNVAGLIAQDCSGSGSNVGRAASKFIVTGRGGLPPYQPGEPLNAEATIINGDSSEAGAENHSAETTSKPPTRSTPSELVEAQGWVFNEKGEVVLTAYPTSATPYSSSSTPTITCYAP